MDITIEESWVGIIATIDSSIKDIKKESHVDFDSFEKVYVAGSLSDRTIFKNKLVSERVAWFLFLLKKEVLSHDLSKANTQENFFKLSLAAVNIRAVELAGFLDLQDLIANKNDLITSILDKIHNASDLLAKSSKAPSQDLSHSKYFKTILKQKFSHFYLASACFTSGEIARKSTTPSDHFYSMCSSILLFGSQELINSIAGLIGISSLESGFLKDLVDRASESAASFLQSYGINLMVARKINEAIVKRIKTGDWIPRFVRQDHSRELKQFACLFSDIQDAQDTLEKWSIRLTHHYEPLLSNLTKDSVKDLANAVFGRAIEYIVSTFHLCSFEDSNFYALSTLLKAHLNETLVFQTFKIIGMISQCENLFKSEFNKPLTFLNKKSCRISELPQKLGLYCQNDKNEKYYFDIPLAWRNFSSNATTNAAHYGYVCANKNEVKKLNKTLKKAPGTIKRVKGAILVSHDSLAVIPCDDRNKIERIDSRVSTLENFQNLFGGYIRKFIKNNDDNAYTAFKITRADALVLLQTNLNDSTIELLKASVEAALLKKDFYDYLIEKKLLANVSYDEIKIAPSKYATLKEVVIAYIGYDVQDKRIGNGRAYPAVLRALAFIQKKELRIWQLNEDDQLLPYRTKNHDFHIFKPTQKKAERVDLLFINKDHFDRLSFEGYRNKYPADNEIIYPHISLKLMPQINSRIFNIEQEQEALKKEQEEQRKKQAALEEEQEAQRKKQEDLEKEQKEQRKREGAYRKKLNELEQRIKEHLAAGKEVDITVENIEAFIFEIKSTYEREPFKKEIQLKSGSMPIKSCFFNLVLVEESGEEKPVHSSELSVLDLTDPLIFMSFSIEVLNYSN